MSKFSAGDVEKTATLARLKLNDAQIPDFEQKLSDILNLADQMAQINTDPITPMAHPLNAKQHLRDDIVTEQNERDKLQKNAPATEAGLILVPQVIE